MAKDAAGHVYTKAKSGKWSSLVPFAARILSGEFGLGLDTAAHLVETRHALSAMPRLAKDVVPKSLPLFSGELIDGSVQIDAGHSHLVQQDTGIGAAVIDNVAAWIGMRNQKPAEVATNTNARCVENLKQKTKNSVRITSFPTGL
jgi:hypothetical protein